MLFIRLVYSSIPLKYTTLMTIESNLKKEMFDIRKYCKSQTVC